MNLWNKNCTEFIVLHYKIKESWVTYLEQMPVRSNYQSLIPSANVIQLTLTLKMTTTEVVKMAVTVNKNSPIQDSITRTIILNLLMMVLFIKNWLMFLNFNLFNQNIVNSHAAMTVNCDKSKPEHTHANTKIWLDINTMQYHHMKYLFMCNLGPKLSCRKKNFMLANERIKYLGVVFLSSHNSRRKRI